MVIDVDCHIGLFETLINWDINVMRDGFLAILLGLFGWGTAGLLSSVLSLWRHGLLI